MTTSQNNLVWQQAKQEKIIYEYLRHSVASKPPQEMLREFRYLFLELVHTNKEVRQTLENIIAVKHKEDIFLKILYYCCHILINCWSQKVDNYPYIIKLIEIFAQNRAKEKKFNNRYRKKLFTLVKTFVDTEEYHNLKRLALFINNNSELKLKPQSLISELLPHYYYLYPSLLLGKEHIPETTNLILNIQQKRQKIFESELAKHLIYRSRLIQIARANQLSNRAGKIIKRVENPTFLTEKDLKKTLKQYLNKIDNKITLYQAAKQFIIKINFITSYKDFKKSLSQYLIVGIQNSETNKYPLQEKLNQVIYNNIYDQYDSQPCTEQLIFYSCQRLLRFLIIDTTRQGNHYQLIELIMNLGTTQTTSLLIKIILISPRAKLDFEQRLGILFSFYESRTIEEAQWLIKFLENILIAYSFYFGNINSIISQIK